MRIAQVAPFYESVPAKYYGETERVAMACGTPVIAYSGAISEVMKQGHAGFIVEGLEDAAEAVLRVPELSRNRCREICEQRFTATRMAHDDMQVCERLISSGRDQPLEARA
jgi:glycosyltransferase involved in cell wall biosynthesis